MELEVLDRGEHGHCGTSIPQVGWLFIVFVCMPVCVHHAVYVEVRRQLTTVISFLPLCEFRILNSGCRLESKLLYSLIHFDGHILPLNSVS